MNNEPVAWIGTEAIKAEWDFVPVTKNKRFDSDVALYTHPAKTLTDDEIVDIGTEFLAPKDCDIYTFARAILRKASEK